MSGGSTRPAGVHRRAGGRRTWRWPAFGSAAALAAALGILLAAQSLPVPACAAVAAVPTGRTLHRGVATFYPSVNGGGNCSFVTPPPGNLVVALSPGEYAAAGACGSYLDVTGPRGHVRVKVVDQCPECATGHIDLSREAFTRIADPVQGLVPVTFRAVVDPAVPGPLSFRIKEGASRWWFAVLVDNHGDPLSRVEVRSGGGAWHAVSRKDYNYWIFQSGLGPGPFSIRVSDVYGHRGGGLRGPADPGEDPAHHDLDVPPRNRRHLDRHRHDGDQHHDEHRDREHHSPPRRTTAALAGLRAARELPAPQTSSAPAAPTTPAPVTPGLTPAAATDAGCG